ncbi:MAG: hypothetical protein ACQESR_05075 [Planctomycetota bacterium]
MFQPTLERLGDESLVILIRDLVADWGTGLHPSLYRRAIVDCLGTEAEPEHMLPMMSGDHSIGNQRFHLLDSETAIGVTSFSELTAENLQDFQKLTAASPLRQLHWLNIALHQLTLCTLANDRKL